MIKTKSKAEYLRKKKLKQEAKQRESEHKIDYTNCPVRDQPVNRRGIMENTGMMELAMMMNMMRRKRKPIIPYCGIMNTIGEDSNP